MSCRDRPPVVVFAPNWSQGNPYLDCLGSSLQGLGVSIVLKDYPSRWLVLNALKSAVPDATVIHIHWLHTLIAPILWTGSGWRRRARLRGRVQRQIDSYKRHSATCRTTRCATRTQTPPHCSRCRWRAAADRVPQARWASRGGASQSVPASAHHCL